MKLEKNRRKSFGDKSCLVDIGYFFIKDLIQCENIDLQCYLAERMISDFYTKPLKGSLFIKIRNFIIGLDNAFCEECIENCVYLEKSPEIQNTLCNDNNENTRRKPTYAGIVKREIK